MENLREVEKKKSDSMTSWFGRKKIEKSDLEFSIYRKKIQFSTFNYKTG